MLESTAHYAPLESLKYLRGVVTGFVQTRTKTTIKFDQVPVVFRRHLDSLGGLYLVLIVVMAYILYLHRMYTDRV